LCEKTSILSDKTGKLSDHFPGVCALRYKPVVENQIDENQNSQSE
jgi:hypothetical protein